MGQLPGSLRDLEDVLGRLKGYVGPDLAPNAPMSEQEAYEIHGVRNEQLERVVAERFLLKNLAGNDVMTARSEVRAKAAEIDSERSVHRQSTLEAVGKTLGWLAGVKGRRSLVLASRGFVYDNRLDGYRKTIEASRRANVPVHLLDARSLDGLASPDTGVQQVSSSDLGLQAHTAQASAGRFAESEGAEHVALDTGGLVVRKRNDLAGGLRLITEANRSLYLLGYYPKDERRDGNWRKLKVEVAKGPGKREVRARRGYFAPL
jgi:VWFA-related protein